MCAFVCTKSLSLSPSPSRRFSIGPTTNRRSINFDTNSTNCQLAATLQHDDHCMTHLHLLASFHALASEGLMQRNHRDSIFSDNSILEYCPSFNKLQTLVVSVLFNCRERQSCMSCMSPTGKARLSRQKQAKVCTCLGERLTFARKLQFQDDRGKTVSRVSGSCHSQCLWS